MKWYSKLIVKINLFLAKRGAKREFEESGHGAGFGWYIEYEGQKIGELLEPKFSDMFWYSYKLVVYDEFKDFVLDVKNWEKCDFKYLNKHYLQYSEYGYASPVIYNHENDELRISMRALYLSALPI
jgi:hypothetical protein